MTFLIAVSNLLSRQDHALREIAEHEVNGRMLRLSLQINRLRTAPEQSDVLNSYYRKTLDALQTLDDEGAYQIPMMLQMLPDSGLNIAQVSETVSRFGALGGSSGELEKIDFSQIENAEIHEIPVEHPAFGVLMNYKDYLVHEGFLDRVKELMDLSDSHQDGDKLSAVDVAEVKDEKATHLTAAQKVLAVHYLMRWSGIELGQRQGAKQQRFIAALTGISVGTVKEKFPSLNVTGKPYHIDNLEALVPLFESIGALKLVDKIQTDIRFEREERGQ